MRKVIRLNIPKPCHENWNTMTPKERGRHCQVCKKTVLDFTNTTDEQIIKTLEQEGALCGRFKKDQLGREIVLRRKKQNNYLTFVASSLFAFLSLGIQDIKAQNKTKIIKVDSLKRQSIKGKEASSILNEKLITGTVIEEINGHPLPFVNVVIKGTNKGTQTDFDGHYKIRVKPGDVLEFKYLGYEDLNIQVSKENVINAILIEGLMGDVVIVGYTNLNRVPELTPAERLERSIQNKKRTRNYFKFYKRKLKENKQKRKESRKEKRKNE